MVAISPATTIVTPACKQQAQPAPIAAAPVAVAAAPAREAAAAIAK
jgi:hypothetical protein